MQFSASKQRILILISQFLYRFSSITNQIADISARLDNMEISLKKDVRTILEILSANYQQPPQQHVQPQQQYLLHQMQQQQQQQPQQTSSQTNLSQQSHQHQIDKPNLMMTTSYQPSENEFSFDLFGLDSKRQRMPSTTNVHRSISQPECATNTTNEKSLFK